MANYKFSNRVRNFSGILMILGIIGLAYGFLSAPSNLEEAQAMISDSHHGEGHSEKVSNQGDNSSTSYHNEKESLSEHNDHSEHLLHKLQNKPWAALYVSALFFMMISLGTLAFYAIQRASQAGWSPVLYRVCLLYTSPSPRDS